MKLKDFLAEMDPNDLVAIGAVSSYFYFGSPDNLDEINSVSDDLYIASGIRLGDVKVLLKNLPNYKTEYDKELETLLKRIRSVAGSRESAAIKKKELDYLDKEVTKLVDKMTELEHRKHLYRAEIKRLSLYRSTFTKLLEREVVKHYRQSASDFAYVLIVEGSERGGYWTKQEYEAGANYEEDEESVEWMSA